jgi:hypothetical protein
LNRSGYYIHLENGSSFIAGGLYCPEANDLKKNVKIAYFHEDLEAILNEKEFKEFNDFDQMKKTLKSARGYEKRTSRY